MVNKWLEAKVMLYQGCFQMLSLYLILTNVLRCRLENKSQWDHMQMFWNSELAGQNPKLNHHPPNQLGG